ncbi:MAG: 4-diphosphocytidyl-2C-methyl-D-erythritol kinase [Alphaproteobacteria bacterium]|nr:4-diphosphocytidyl-2C-methyl-D-erythritol kinase [Alphaproteobacteria bacterium]
MKFAEVPIDSAVGLILAHSIRLSGRAFKKGHVLSAADIELLRNTSLKTVAGVTLEADDVGEDEAAFRLASALKGSGLTLGKAYTGRCNLYAEERGLVVVDTVRLDRINSIDEAITIGTLRPFELIDAEQMVATVKLIPFSVPRAFLDRCIKVASEAGPVIRMAKLRGRAVGLIQTRLPGTRETVLDSTTSVTRVRLNALGCELRAEHRCAHDAAKVAQAVRTMLDEGCAMILIACASAIIDRNDTVPAGIVSAGGAIDHFGMPVDPGNLLLLAHHGTTPVLGLPGCARSPKLNGFDWVLQRLIADVPVTRHDIMTMGAGGLLMEIPSRPLPRVEASPKPEKPKPLAERDRKPRVAAVVLAAGQSRRMGGANKLLVPIDGRPLLTGVVDAVLRSTARPVIVVIGHQAEAVRAALAGRDVTFAHNSDYEEGMSASVRVGLEALPPGLDGALICLGDMPRTDPALIDRLIGAFNPPAGRAIGVPTYLGKRGNPVLWSARYFPEIMQLDGDVGARHLIGQHAEVVYEIECDDRSAMIDLDTPEAFAAHGVALPR